MATLPKPALRLLVVDNNLADQEMIGEMLPEHGIAAELTAVTEGAEALDLLAAIAEGRAPAPDLVLLDLHLGRIGGRAVLATIRAHPRLRHLPVLVLTTADDAGIRAECLALGANEFLIKPRLLTGFAAIAAAIRRHAAPRGDGAPALSTPSRS